MIKHSFLVKSNESIEQKMRTEILKCLIFEHKSKKLLSTHYTMDQFSLWMILDLVHDEFAFLFLTVADV